MSDANTQDVTRFSHAWWDDFLRRSNGMRSPIVSKDCIAAAETLAYTEAVMEILRILCRLRTSQYGFRVYIEGKILNRPEMSAFFDDGPVEGETLEAWGLRAFKGRKFGIIINTGEKFVPELSLSIARKLSPLFEKVGMPREGVNFTLFIGNYDKTPLGIHQDNRGENVIHFHLGPAQKTMFVWSPEKYQSLADQGISRLDVAAMKAQADVFEFGVGDIFFMPEGTWHIGEQEGLGIGLTIWQYNHTNSHLMENLHRQLYIRMFNKRDATVENDPHPIDVSTGLDGVMSNASAFDEYKDLTYEQLLREVYVDWRHGFASNCAYRGVPFPRTENYEVGLGDTVRLEAPYKILYRKIDRNGKLNIYVRGHIFQINYFSEVERLIDRLNSASDLLAAELVKAYEPHLPGPVTLYILSEIAHFGGIVVDQNALVEA